MQRRRAHALDGVRAHELDDPDGPLRVLSVETPRGRIQAGAGRSISEARRGSGAGGDYQAAGLEALERGPDELLAYVQACRESLDRPLFIALAPQQQENLELLVGFDVLVEQRAHIFREIVRVAHESPERVSVSQAGISGPGWGSALLIRITYRNRTADARARRRRAACGGPSEPTEAK